MESLLTTILFFCVLRRLQVLPWHNSNDQARADVDDDDMRQNINRKKIFSSL